MYWIWRVVSIDYIEQFINILITLLCDLISTADLELTTSLCSPQLYLEVVAAWFSFGVPGRTVGSGRRGGHCVCRRSSSVAPSDGSLPSACSALGRRRGGPADPWTALGSFSEDPWNRSSPGSPTIENNKNYQEWLTSLAHSTSGTCRPNSWDDIVQEDPNIYWQLFET